MTTRVRLEVEGRGFAVDVAVPPGSARRGALILVHEWHGLNDGIRSLADRLASSGFLVLAPDLYFGEVAIDDAGAGALMTAMKTGVSLEIFAVCAAHAKSHPNGNGKVGIVGFCMGGAMAFAASTSVSGLSAAVPFYGVPMAKYLDAALVGCPIQAHFAREDAWAPAQKAEAFQASVRAAGKSMELFVYDAGHAFMREGDPSTYDAASASLAFRRATEFLHTHLD